MKYKAAIFDLDGTTLNTLDDLALAVNHALAELGLPQRTVEEVRGFAGNGVRKLIERSVGDDTKPVVECFSPPSCAAPLDEKCIETTNMVDSVYKAFSEYYAVHCADNTRPYDGIAEMVKEARGWGMKTAIVSNKDDYAVQELVAGLMPGLFDFVVGVSAAVRTKPAPDAALAAMKAVGCNASECVYIGDSEVDIQTAHNAGLPCISVAWGFKTRQFLVEHGAQVIVDSPRALLDELR